MISGTRQGSCLAINLRSRSYTYHLRPDSFIPSYANGLDWQDRGKALRDLAIKPASHNFFLEDGVCMSCYSLSGVSVGNTFRDGSDQMFLENISGKLKTAEYYEENYESMTYELRFSNLSKDTYS